MAVVIQNDDCYTESKMMVDHDPLHVYTFAGPGPHVHGFQPDMRFEEALDKPLCEAGAAPLPLDQRVWTLRQLCYLIFTLKLQHHMRDNVCDKLLRVMSIVIEMLTAQRVFMPPSLYHLKKVLGVRASYDYERCVCANATCLFPGVRGRAGECTCTS